MDRLDIMNSINENVFDVIIIGGGATGLGIALDSVTRGYKTLLVEALDFAKGTSSRSTKLLHGGVRYLEQGNVSLVHEALRERHYIIKNAPHLCRKQAFIIPTNTCFKSFYYAIGLSIYDFMAGKLGIGKTHYLNKTEAQKRLKNIRDEQLKAGVCYYDGQFDDARLALTLARSAIEKGAYCLNYTKATHLLKNNNGIVEGVEICDYFSTETKKVYAQCIINATGVFASEINAHGGVHDDIIPSQGVHLVVDRSFLPTEAALMIPKTSDGRVLFALPWKGKLILGTTDTIVEHIEYEPLALDEEIDFIIKTANEYFTHSISRADVKSVFVGLRPLVKPSKMQESKKVSRSHKIDIAPSKLITINGGKWTTYRSMAEECLDFAIKQGLLKDCACVTKDIKLFGYQEGGNFDDRLCGYGSEGDAILKLEQEDAKMAECIHPEYPYTYAQVFWAIKHEMALRIEDVLARRIRLLFLDAKATQQCAYDVATFMASYLHWDEKRLQEEIKDFIDLAAKYQI